MTTEHTSTNQAAGPLGSALSDGLGRPLQPWRANSEEAKDSDRS
jgi:hypothetical protein